MKVVVDVNVWISALLWGGVPDKVLILAEDKKITIFASEALFLELETTLRRRKFKSKIQSLDLNVDDVINATRDAIQMCPGISVDAPQLRDSKDIEEGRRQRAEGRRNNRTYATVTDDKPEA